jgi:hypothetical protein
MCSAIEILSISPSSASIGDKVVIQGNNLGDNNSGQKIYIGADIINISDVSNWNDNEIDLKIGSYVKGGNIVLRTYDGKVISGPNLTILAKNSDASSGGGTSGDSGKITLNQQINIAGASTDASAVKNGTTSNASTTSVAVANTQSSGGVISSVSSFFGSLFDGFKNFFSAIFS